MCGSWASKKKSTAGAPQSQKPTNRPPGLGVCSRIIFGNMAGLCRTKNRRSDRTRYPTLCCSYSQWIAAKSLSRHEMKLCLKPERPSGLTRKSNHSILKGAGFRPSTAQLHGIHNFKAAACWAEQPVASRPLHVLQDWTTWTRYSNRRKPCQTLRKRSVVKTKSS